MKKKLPSLLGVRYFESVGRNLSFKLAATELNVTQAAVSHQIRFLEKDLGVKLFTRLHQRIELTKEGISLLEVATECLDRLSETFDHISGRTKSTRVHVNITPLLSAHWLMPQIYEFLDSKNGEVEIILHHSLEPPSALEAKYDIKLFYSTHVLSDPRYNFLFEDRIVPICSPRLLTRNGATDPSTLLSQARLVHEFNYDWWMEWCRKRSLDPSLAQKGLVLDDPAVLENAALQERGIILGSIDFLNDRLQSGELVLPFGPEPSIAIWYYSLLDQSRGRKRAAVDFYNWISERAERSRKLFPLNRESLDQFSQR